MTSLKLTNSIPACHLQLILSDPLRHWKIPPSSSYATFCCCHHLVHNITSTLGQISSQLRSGLIALALLWLTHPTHTTLGQLFHWSHAYLPPQSLLAADLLLRFSCLLRASLFFYAVPTWLTLPSSQSYSDTSTCAR